LSSSKDKGKN